MTSTTLAGGAINRPVIDFTSARSCQSSTTVDAASILASLQAGTGRAQVARKAQEVPVRNLLPHWEQAMATVPKTEWRLLAEDLFDLVEGGGVQLTAADSAFLIHVATDLSTPPYAANTAIRLMGMLAEEHLIDLDPVLSALEDLLVHDDTQRRYYAVKALWQAKARGALGALKRCAQRESSADVLSILPRAIAVLESYALDGDLDSRVAIDG